MQKLQIVHLRSAVIQYMKNHSEETINDTTIAKWLEMIQMVENNPKYLETMSRNSTWGGAPEISVIAKMFKVRIHVFFRGRSVAVFHPTDVNQPITTDLYLNWTGGHYTPIKRMG